MKSPFLNYKCKLCLATLILLFCIMPLIAQTGNIDETDKWSWGTNIGWINFYPQFGGVTVYSDHLEGYAWAENIGWIRLGTHTSGPPYTYGNDDPTDYGVNHDGSGNLSGFAWSTNAGWINFNPSHSQVIIDISTGSFEGYAWGENIGWIHFKNSLPEYNVMVTTDLSLPVELISFNAENSPGGVLLTWSTASETENLGYIIERKKHDQDTWLHINDYLHSSALKGQATSTETHNYRYIDQQVQPGTGYSYRLSDVDYSGKINRGDVIKIVTADQDHVIPDQFGLQKVYPNPFNPITTIRYGLTEEAHTTISIYNMRGQWVQTLLDHDQVAGIYSIRWQANNISSGLYFVCLESGDQTSFMKVMFVK